MHRLTMILNHGEKPRHAWWNIPSVIKLKAIYIDQKLLQSLFTPMETKIIKNFEVKTSKKTKKNSTSASQNSFFSSRKSAK